MRTAVLIMVALVVTTTSSAQIPMAKPVTEPKLASPSAAKSEASLLSPPLNGGPVVIRAGFQVSDINDIDDEAETFEFGGVLTLTWHDERQAFDPAQAGVDEKIYQGTYQFNEIYTGWFPQMGLVNESGFYEKHGVILRVQPDGNLTLVEMVNAIAEAEINLRRYPFDRHQLDATFEVLSTNNAEVVFQAESETSSPSDHQVRTPQWNLTEVSTLIGDRHGSRGVASVFVVSMKVQRDSFFMIRLVVFPLAMIVMLSWSVFWMERSSLGDRVNVSFIGILTAVAYQIMVSEILPKISYVTLMHGFLNLSFLLMCGTVVINLVVGALDRQGKYETGDRVDRHCRWIFPLTYFGLNLIMVGVTFAFF